MEALFVNRYTPSIKLFERFYRKTALKYSRVIGIIGLASLAVLLLVLIWIGRSNTPILLAILVGAAFCFGLIFLHKLMAYGAMRRTMKAHGGDIYPTTVTFTDKITLREGTQTASLKYIELTEVVDCGSLLALLVGRGNGVIVKKDGFTKGDYKAFSAFLNEKISKSHR